MLAPTQAAGHLPLTSLSHFPPCCVASSAAGALLHHLLVVRGGNASLPQALHRNNLGPGIMPRPAAKQPTRQGSCEAFAWRSLVGAAQLREDSYGVCCYCVRGRQAGGPCIASTRGKVLRNVARLCNRTSGASLTTDCRMGAAVRRVAARTSFWSRSGPRSL